MSRQAAYQCSGMFPLYSFSGTKVLWDPINKLQFCLQGEFLHGCQQPRTGLFVDVCFQFYTQELSALRNKIVSSFTCVHHAGFLASLYMGTIQVVDSLTVGHHSWLLAVL